MRTEPSFSMEPEEPSLEETMQSQSNSVENHDTLSDSLSGHLSDYRQRFGVSVDPFADDHHFPFYTGAQRRHILDQLLHFCQFGNNLLVVLGEYSLGKTRIAQALIDQLDEADDICFLEGQIDSTCNSLIAGVFEQFELADADAFDVFVSKEASPEGVAVIIIDNAHHIEDTDLAQLISFVYNDPEARVHLVLLAEPHLLPRLERMESIEVGITDFMLERFSLTEATDYLNFRMEMADYLGPEIFTESKVEPWWRRANGQLSVLHESAQQDLLRAVTPAKKVPLNKKGLPLPHIIGASVLGAGLLMAGIYWGGAPAPKAVQNPIPVPITKVQEPVAGVSTLSSAAQDVSSVNATPATQVIADEAPAAAQSMSDAVASNAAVETQNKEATVVKQSVVPLAQTNSLSETKVAVSKVAKSASASPVKENKKAEVVQPDSKSIEKPSKNTPEKITLAPSDFSEQEKAILGWPDADYTIQLVGLSSEKAVRDFLVAQPNKKDLLLFKSTRQGKDWYVVITGRFASSAKARQAIELLPDVQKKASPWPRELRVIQKEIRQR